MMMKCISTDEGSQLLQDIHSGVCSAHSSWCSIVGKAFRHGFYWPTAKDDVMEIITKCKECQFFQKQTTKDVNPVRPIDLSWPFCGMGNRHHRYSSKGSRMFQDLIRRHRYIQ
jgi:hypothetical protein